VDLRRRAIERGETAHGRLARQAARLAGIAAAVLLLARCGGDGGPTDPPVDLLPNDGATYWPAADWRRATPAQVGIDRAAIDAVVARLRSNEVQGIHSLTVVRNGYMAVEEYFNGSSRDSVHTMQSVTKSVTSLLAGIAIADGKLRLSDSVVRVFSKYTSLRDLDDRKRGVTVRDLLTMRSGIDFYEQPYEGSPLQALNTSRDDWVRLVLDRPMNDAPDGHWQYNSGGVIVLGGALRQVMGTNVNVFARERLFGPLGVQGQFWYVSAFDSLPHTGGGLNLRAVDMARIGYLVLREGRWNGTQIVPADWIRASMVPRTRGTSVWAGHSYDYGYLWWLSTFTRPGSTTPDTIYTASGSGGQWIFIVPRYDLVITFTAAAADFSAPANLVYSSILPAIR
jgi:CubicO group peptidase (beta-lactamase class C family)